MNLFEFSLNDKVLLLGEGNFSFSCCLLKNLQEKFGEINFSNVYATCYQKDISTSASVNAEYLRNLGAVVLLGIDATQLELSNDISYMKFDKIIFNFPHVGGKMKIHLNRELIRKFFISSSKVLQTRGQVIITLCSGQGGTEYEVVNRNWNDTWQIIEQASHGGLILYKVERFPHFLFQEYSPVGYRGREQKFSTMSAVVHGFCRGKSPLTVLTDDVLKDIQGYHILNDVPDLQVPYCYKVALSNNPLASGNSAQFYIMKVLYDCFKKYSLNFLDVSEDCVYHIDSQNIDSLAPCLYKGKECSLRNSLLQVTPQLKHDFFAKGLVFRKCSSNFSVNIASCHCVMHCKQFCDVVRDLFAIILLKFNFCGTLDEEISGDSWMLFLDSEAFSRIKVAWGDRVSNLVTVDLDIICSYIFKITLRELWTDGIKFDQIENRLITPSLYPLRFKFDICFASCEDLDYNKFYHCLHQVPDKLIESVELLSIFQHVGSNEKSYCFRLCYRSYEVHLHRKLVIEIHQNVIGKLLEKVINVRVH